MKRVTTDSTNPAGQPAGSSRIGRRVIAVALSLAVLLPVGLAVGLFPLMSGGPFDSLDTIDPTTVAGLRVHVLNRAGLDGGEDVGPFEAASADYPALLSPLHGLTPLASRPEVVGPWLGEYRIRTLGSRRATIRLYWTKRPDTGQTVTPAAIAGPAVVHGRPELVPGMFALRAQVGGNWFEGGQPLTLIAAVEAAATHSNSAR